MFNTQERFSLEGVAEVCKSIRSICENDWEGRCFAFHLALKQYYPEAVCMYDGNHVTSLIYGRLWDKTGLVAYPLMSEPRIYKDAFHWE